jgi:hypothetical protein
MLTVLKIGPVMLEVFGVTARQGAELCDSGDGLSPFLPRYLAVDQAVAATHGPKHRGTASKLFTELPWLDFKGRRLRVQTIEGSGRIAIDTLEHGEQNRLALFPPCRRKMLDPRVFVQRADKTRLWREQISRLFGSRPNLRGRNSRYTDICRIHRLRPNRPIVVGDAALLLDREAERDAGALPQLRHAVPACARKPGQPPLRPPALSRPRARPP